MDPHLNISMIVPTSANGTKRTFQCAQLMSTFGGKADIAGKLLTRDEVRRIAANIAKRRDD